MTKISLWITTNTWIILFFIMTMMMLNFFSPIIMISLLIFYGSLVCLNLSMWSMNFLYSIMLFLIMISGMLIIFMYFSSLISNEQLKFTINRKHLLIMAYPLILLILSHLNPIPTFFMHSNNETTPIMFINLYLYKNMMNLYNYPFNNLSLLCMIFLLFTLLMIIKVCSLNNSPLRKLTKYV